MFSMEVKILLEGRTSLVAHVSGRIDNTTVKDFEQEIQKLFDHPGFKITLEMSGTEYINSSGLRVLLILRKLVAANEGQVIVRGLSADLRHVFEITGFDKIFDLR